MGKDTRLVNIYIKIHNKRNLTIEDLNYLSKYDPECFEKTCRNVVYNVPGAKEVLQAGQEQEERKESQGEEKKKDLFAPEQADKKQIEAALSNLKQMEQGGLPVGEMDVDTVKNLLGNLYMEMLFPHNGRTRFFNMEDQEYRSVFNKKV